MMCEYRGCNIEVNSEEKLIIKATPKSIEIYLCQKHINNFSKVILKKLNRYEHNNLILKCKTCGAIFANRNALAGHTNWHKEGFDKNNVIKRSGEKSTSWKGERAGYFAIHRWIRKYKIKPLQCPICRRQKPLDVINISGKYTRNLDDWGWMCRRCHMVSDDRLKNIVANNSKKKIIFDKEKIAKMYFQEGKTVIEIGRELNLPVDTIIYRNCITPLRKQFKLTCIDRNYRLKRGVNKVEMSEL